MKRDAVGNKEKRRISIQFTVRTNLSTPVSLSVVVYDDDDEPFHCLCCVPFVMTKLQCRSFFFQKGRERERESIINTNRALSSAVALYAVRSSSMLAIVRERERTNFQV